MNDKKTLEYIIGQLDHSYNHGYYLDQDDIAKMVIFIFRASEYGIDKSDFIKIVTEAIENYE